MISVDRGTKGIALVVLSCMSLTGFIVAGAFFAAPSELRAQTAASRSVGTIKSIDGGVITLTTDAGATAKITSDSDTKFLRVEPGEKDLKNAVKIAAADLKPGDRILAIGSGGASAISATTIVAMKHEDVVSRQQKDLQDWQRRGVGGLVKTVDAASGTVTVSVAGGGADRSIAVHTSKDTIIRRYAPDSVKFDDAKVSSLDQLKPGDQLRARGTRNADGSELTAEEIVSGAFHNLSGLIIAIDTSANTLTLNDLVTKKPVVVKISPDSQLRKLPPQMAQMVVAAGRGGANPAGSQGQGASGAAPQGAGSGAAGGQQGGGFQGGGGQGANGGGRGQGGGQFGGGGGGRGGFGGGRGQAGDLQQILGRLPASTLMDFQKGDAVMIVSTEGTAAGGVTAITVVGGVEAILQANGDQPMNLPAWSLGGGDAGGDAGGAQ